MNKLVPCIILLCTTPPYSLAFKQSCSSLARPQALVAFQCYNYAEKTFSLCNIGKLGGPGDEVSHADAWTTGDAHEPNI